MKQFFLFFFLIFYCTSWTQTTLDSLQQLEEVVLMADKHLETFSNTLSVKKIKDTTLRRSASSLTQLLNYNSSIYFKENGLGMVSSPAFRGTTAQQTAVTWNGININSQLNGQTDFNTINIRNFDEIDVRSGGGSVLYGSGAVGGSIHLNNYIEFNTGFENTLQTNYGSFNTIDIGLKSRYASEIFAADVAISRASSDNDYDFIDSQEKNTNGQYYNQSLSVNFGYKINAKNILKLYSYLFDGERHFSLISPTETPTKYQDFTHRTMMEWIGFYGKFTSNFKIAYLSEDYKYFENIDSNNYTFGEAKSIVGKYNLDYKLLKKARLQTVFDLTHTSGKGTSIEQNERTIFGMGLLFKQQYKKVLYEFGIRKEVTNNYESPLLYSLGLRYKAGEHYEVNLNASKNFRIPNYNDLYWQGSGNPNLNPETSFQIEIGQELFFEHVNFRFTGFYNDITDMIRWVPTTSLWHPINTDHVLSYGLEAELGLNFNIKSHQLSFEGQYAYTISKNQDTEKYLIYVPKHKASAMLEYQYNRAAFYCQTLFVGEVFTLSDNNPEYVLDAYSVYNLGAEYSLGKQQQFVFGAQIKNIFNENYQSVAERFMPGIHYNFYLNLNF